MGFLGYTKRVIPKYGRNLLKKEFLQDISDLSVFFVMSMFYHILYLLNLLDARMTKNMSKISKWNNMDLLVKISCPHIATSMEMMGTVL